MWRSRNGDFSTVEQILELEGFGIKVLETFCNSVVKDEIKKNAEKPKLIRFRNLTTPIFPDHLTYSVKSLVSVHIGISGISWSLIEIERDPDRVNINDWNMYSIPDKKYHLSELTKLVIDVCTDIPSTDLYIIENPLAHQQSTGPSSISRLNINLQQSQITAMFSALLENRNSSIEPNLKRSTVFFLRRYLAYRFFDVLIGNENVSISAVVNDLLGLQKISTGYDIIINPSTNVIDKYNKTHKVDREMLGQSLLIGTVFVQLCVLKCPSSHSWLMKNR